MVFPLHTMWWHRGVASTARLRRRTGSARWASSSDSAKNWGSQPAGYVWNVFIGCKRGAIYIYICICICICILYVIICIYVYVSLFIYYICCMYYILIYSVYHMCNTYYIIFYIMIYKIFIYHDIYIYMYTYVLQIIC